MTNVTDSDDSNLSSLTNSPSDGQSTNKTLDQDPSYEDHLSRKYNNPMTTVVIPSATIYSTKKPGWGEARYYQTGNQQSLSSVSQENQQPPNTKNINTPIQQAPSPPLAHDSNTPRANSAQSTPRNEMDSYNDHKRGNGDDSEREKPMSNKQQRKKRQQQQLQQLNQNRESTSSTTFMEQRDKGFANNPLQASLPKINDPSPQNELNTKRSFAGKIEENPSPQTEINTTNFLEKPFPQNNISNDKKKSGMQQVVTEPYHYVPELTNNKKTDPLLFYQQPKKIHSVALFIYFNVDYAGYTRILPTKRGFTQYGFTRLIKSFEYKTRTNAANAIIAAKEFTLECAINCWRNNKNLTLFCAAQEYAYTDCEFVKSIREVCDNETLDVIVIRPNLPPYSIYYMCEPLDRAGATSVVYSRDELVANSILHILEASTKKLASDMHKVDFYNKDEPYYEFTNFYRAKVTIDTHTWPTTEHYFQAQKFESQYIQKRIRDANTARDAFSIARSRDYDKRANWESRVPPRGFIFKEEVMERAQLCKYSQNPSLKYKLLSTATADLYEHTSNDTYWGDGGNDRKGLNRLGYTLAKVRSQLMCEEIHALACKYQCPMQKMWIVPELCKMDSVDNDDDLYIDMINNEDPQFRSKQ
ncbi:6242_t:CDS:2 [Ambispora gerdemannii]|uniref:6242_t:CDS:1 n=1 Tax=Ambispora gerdemannii TaxID=144530 RepID=A0A9N9AMU3_9GLOM|nr:6242_t:CDS:2 [Ambispora gerdemannii]